MSTITNSWISIRCHELLVAIRDSKSKELTLCRPGGWWIDNHRIKRRAAIQEAQQWCLIKETYSEKDDSYKIFRLTDDGIKTLNDPNHQPLIVDAWRKNNAEKRVT